MVNTLAKVIDVTMLPTEAKQCPHIFFDKVFSIKKRRQKQAETLEASC